MDHLQLPVDYQIGIHQLWRMGAYASGFDELFWDTPVEDKPPAELTVGLVAFDEIPRKAPVTVATHEVTEAFKSAGMRALTLQEGLFLGVQYPDLQAAAMIACLAGGPSNTRDRIWPYCLVLDNWPQRGGRGARLEPDLSHSWGGRYLFAGCHH